MGRFLNAVRNFAESLGLVAESSSEKARAAAEGTRDTDVVAHQIDEEITASAQRVTDAANEVIAQVAEKRAKVARLRQNSTHWGNMARENLKAAMALPEGSPERVRLETLAKNNLKSKQGFDAQLEIEEPALAALQPHSDKAEEVLHRSGFERQAIRNTATILRVQDATAEMRIRLANAEQQMTGDGTLATLQAELESKVDAKLGRAVAAERVAESLPPSDAAMEAETAVLHSQRLVDSEFEALKASLAPAAPATAA
jgi:hypothetical protein